MSGNDTLLVTSFLEPSEVFAATDAIKSVSKIINLKYAFLGGHKEAEYRRLEIRKDDLIANSDNKYGQEENVWALAVECRASDDASFQPQPWVKIDSVRSALAAMLKVDKRDIGDIALPGQKNAFQCFVTKNAVIAAETLSAQNNISSISLLSMPIESIRVINCSDVKIAPLKEKEMTISEASNRLDAVGSGGFGISRNKMIKLIADGAVTVDWSVITTPSTSIKVLGRHFKEDWDSFISKIYPPRAKVAAECDAFDGRDLPSTRLSPNAVSSTATFITSNLLCPSPRNLRWTSDIRIRILDERIGPIVASIAMKTWIELDVPRLVIVKAFAHSLFQQSCSTLDNVVPIVSSQSFFSKILNVRLGPDVLDQGWKSKYFIDALIDSGQQNRLEVCIDDRDGCATDGSVNGGSGGCEDCRQDGCAVDAA
eukprot:gene22810-31107_t